GVLCLAAAAVLLARQAQAAGKELGLAAGGLAAMLTLMPGSVLDAAIHINGSYVHGLVFAVASIVLAQGRSWPARTGALAAAMAAAFGNAVGLALWPVLA